MNTFQAIALLLVPGFPILMALSVFRRHLVHPCLLAMLPAVFLVILPVDFSLQMPWLLTGTGGLGINHATSPFLILLLIFWSIMTLKMRLLFNHAHENRFIRYYMLIMAGSFGVVLSLDLITFYLFITLMGYAFYAFLVTVGNMRARKGARVYLGFLVVSDLILFEALIVATTFLDKLTFSNLHQLASQSPYLNLYILIVIICFAAKAGIWPLHGWLSPVLRFSRPIVSLMISSIPVTIGWFAILRWLPVSEINNSALDIVFLVLGISAMFYSMVIMFKQYQVTALVVLFNGFLLASTGWLIRDSGFTPLFQNQLSKLLLVLLPVLFLTVLYIVVNKKNFFQPTTIKRDRHYFFACNKQVLKRNIKYLHIKTIKLVAKSLKISIIQAIQKMSRKYIHISLCQLDKFEALLQTWTVAITLLILLGIIFVLIRL